MITVDTELARLEQAQLVRRLLEDDPAYMFKHALTQESACESLLLKKRREIHRQVAQAHERLYPDRLDEFAAVLAGHYAEAGDDVKTVEYATRAADAAARVYAQTEAIAHYTLAIDAAKRSGSDIAQLADLYIRRGRALELAGQLTEAIANYQELEAAARAGRDQVRELDARLRRATVYMMGSAEVDLAEAHSLSMQALQRARELGSREVEARALWNLMLANRPGPGDADKAIEYGEQSAALARELNLPEQLALALHDLGLTCVGIRRYERALEILGQVESLWTAMDNKPLLASAMTVAASIYWSQGNLDQALRVAQAAYTIDHPIGNQYGLTLDAGILAAVWSELGEMDKCLSYIAESEQSCQEGGAWGELAGVRTEAARVCIAVGDWGRAEALAQQALDFYHKAMPSQRARALAVMARLHLLRGDLAAAAATLQDVPPAPFMDYVRQLPLGLAPEAVFTAHAELALLSGDVTRACKIADELIAGVQATGTRLHLPDALHLKARVLLAENQIDPARDVLAQARAQAEAMGARLRLVPVLIALSQVETQCNNMEAAQSLSARAREVTDFIAAHSPPDVRAAYLNQRAIAQLIREG